MPTAISLKDPNCVTLLEEKLARLESERASISAFNKSCRAGNPDISLLAPSVREEYVADLRAGYWQIGPRGEMPSYVAQNLGGVISRERKRLNQALRMYPTPIPASDPRAQTLAG